MTRALADFKNGILFSQDTGLYAYRAIESIKVAFNDSWDKMNTALNINKTYTDSLRKNHGDYQRHGKYSFMTGADRIEMLNIAKSVISRFITYINNGSNNLNSSNFPELS